MKKSKVSVVTVVFNNKDGIKETIESVINQTLPCEYIIIDGGSTDGTVDIIKEYDTQIDYWVSEPDNGIYDAMNKGLQKVTGEWVCFMNSGDRFHDNTVIEDIFQKNYSNKVGVIWGNTDLYNKNKYVSKFKNKPFTMALMPYRTGMGICHQSMFICTRVAKELMFDTKYQISADFAMAYKIYKKGFKFIHVDKTVSNYDISGISSLSENGIKILHENMRIFIESNPQYCIQYLLYSLFKQYMRLKGKV